MGFDSSPMTTGKRPREVQDEETKENNVQVGAEVDVNGNVEEEKVPAPQSTAAATATGVEEDGEDNGDESEEDEEEALVVLELCDFKNHPLFDDYSTATLEGIDTATPMLRIGEYALHGQLEETVGTSYFYDTDTSKVSEKKYRFAGQTIKKIKFTIAPPEDV